MRKNKTNDSGKKNLTKENKPTSLTWFKFPTNLLNEPRIEQLIANEGMKGLGFYIKILCRIYSRQSRCIGEQELLKMGEKGISIKPMIRVYKNYGLFEKDEYCHVYSTIDFANFGETVSKKGTECFEKNFDKISENLSFPTPAPAYYKNKKENKKNDYHHSKKSDDGDGDADNDGATLPPVYRSEPMPRALMDPIQYIHSLPLGSAWAEALLQTMGRTNPTLRQLVMEQWEETKAFFALHAQAQSKVYTLLTENDVKRYFANCLNNPTLARKLQEQLAAKRAEQQQVMMERMRRMAESEA